MPNKKIILTGGGTAGHVTPNLALVPELRVAGYDISYIGSKKGIESRLVRETGIPYKAISSGKLRRYFDIKNFFDPFQVAAGVVQAFFWLICHRPNVIFSKGGFVAVPVVIAAKLLRIPTVCHESDITPGLANRISSKFCPVTLVSFKQTLKYFPEGRAIYTGTPVRKELLDGSADRGLKLCGFDGSKPILLVMGGSQGSAALNSLIRSAIPVLTKRFDIVHGCGKGNYSAEHENIKGYVQFEYMGAELADIFKAASIAVSRAGANSLFEYLCLKLPALLIPLDNGSRGDQMVNAELFAKSGYSLMLNEKDITDAGILTAKIDELYENRPRFIECMKKDPVPDSAAEIINIIKKYS